MWTWRNLGALAVIVGARLNPPAAAQCGSWQPIGEDIGSIVYDAVVFNNELIVAGDLFGATVKRWTGSEWQWLDVPGSYAIFSLAVYNGELYAGGVVKGRDGEDIDGIARWDGANWQFIGTMTLRGGAGVDAMIVYNDELIVAGNFSQIGGQDSPCLARWNGSEWLPFPGFAYGDSVGALAVHENDLIVGGEFATAGGTEANNIAGFDGAGWSALGEGLTGRDATVKAITSYNGDLVAGGDFSLSGGKPTGGIARWDGSEWHALEQPSNDFSPSARSLVVFNGDLIAGGGFKIGNVTRNIARWNGSIWRELGLWSYDPVEALVTFQSDLVAANSDGEVARWHDIPGDCTGACCFQTECIPTSFDECEASGGMFYGAGVFCDQVVCEGQCQTWQPMGELYFDGDHGWLGELTTYGNAVVAVGEFLIIGGTPGWVALASWNGELWQPIDEGLGSFPEIFPRAGVSEGANLYVAGYRAARFDGTSWDLLGGTFSGGIVRSLVLYENELIAGGSFTANDGQPLSGMARWDGTAWQALGGGISGEDPEVRDMAIYDGELIVAGEFVSAGGEPAMNIAAWDGQGWHSLGEGLDGLQDVVANCLIVHDGSLVVGGNFTQAGEQTVTNIASWNGETWQGPFGLVGGPDDGHIFALTVFDEQLFASGLWGDSSQTDRLRRWNSDSGVWEPFFPFNGVARMLLPTDDKLFAGGDFHSGDYAGPETDTVAHWSKCLEPCRTDLTADGTIDSQDLIMVLDAWGQCSDPKDCPADVAPLIIDGSVNVDDLVAVILRWGPCP